MPPAAGERADELALTPHRRHFGRPSGGSFYHFLAHPSVVSGCVGSHVNCLTSKSVDGVVAMPYDRETATQNRGEDAAWSNLNVT